MPIPKSIRRIIYTAGGGVTGVALIQVAAPMVLGWFGISTAGFVAGFAVAGMQAAIGHVAVGSLAMGPAVPVALTVAGAGLGAGVGAVAGKGSGGEVPTHVGDPTDDAGEDGGCADANGEGPVDEGTRMLLM